MRINLTGKQNQEISTSQTHVKWVVGLVFMFMVLSGCGNKGDLYLPEKDDVKNQASLVGEKQSKN